MLTRGRLSIPAWKINRVVSRHAWACVPRAKPRCVASRMGLCAACEGLVFCTYFLILIAGDARSWTVTGALLWTRTAERALRKPGGDPSRRECLAKSESGGIPSRRESLVDLEAAPRPRGRGRLDGELLQADPGVTLSDRWADRNRVESRHVVSGVWSRQTVRRHVTS